MSYPIRSPATDQNVFFGRSRPSQTARLALPRSLRLRRRQSRPTEELVGLFGGRGGHSPAPIVLHVSIVLVNHLFGAPLPTAAHLGAWPEVPVTFVVMLVMVGLGEEAGWTAFAAPILLRRFGLLGAFGVLAPLRILWHLPLMLTGDMPLVVGILGNAGFQLVVLQLMRHRRGSWTLAAVWHATLNAFGGAFFFSMVTGPDRDRLDLLLGLVYALAGAVALLLYVLEGTREATSPRRVGSATATRCAPEAAVLVGKTGHPISVRQADASAVSRGPTGYVSRLGPATASQSRV